ncbi:hypothetical protein B0J14DRAFT_557640 [Halenospora varia]|nr:hypothetical protein B0J14DRAFT_557640 [Halenospora varia]
MSIPISRSSPESPPSLPRVSSGIEIATPRTSNLTVTITKYSHKVLDNFAQGNSSRRIMHQASFLISKSVLLKSSARKYFRDLLEEEGAMGEQGYTVRLDDSVVAVELWLRYIHNTITDYSWRLLIPGLCQVVSVSRNYGFDMKDLEGWFCRWWMKLDKEKLQLDDLRKLLFPCKEFNYAAALAYVSGRLVYEMVGEVKELKPTGDKMLFCEDWVLREFSKTQFKRGSLNVDMAEINFAKARMRTHIANTLCRLWLNICEDDCPRNRACANAVRDALTRVGFVPIKQAVKRSTKELIDGLKNNWHIVIPADACKKCARRLTDHRIKSHMRFIMQFWEGMCLDCKEEEEYEVDFPASLYEEEIDIDEFFVESGKILGVWCFQVILTTHDLPHSELSYNLSQSRPWGIGVNLQAPNPTKESSQPLKAYSQPFPNNSKALTNLQVTGIRCRPKNTEDERNVFEGIYFVSESLDSASHNGHPVPRSNITNT